MKMDIATYSAFLKTPIVSENGVLVFTFSFTTLDHGEVEAYDRLLEVTIKATWNFVKTGNYMLIRIQGFDILKFGELGLTCEVSELEKELRCLESAYDLCFGR